MKRNTDLIKEILLYAEEHCDGKDEHGVRLKLSDLPEKYRDIDETELREHIGLALEENLIDATTGTNPFTLYRLTWKGHDYLDRVR